MIDLTIKIYRAYEILSYASRLNAGDEYNLGYRQNGVVERRDHCGVLEDSGQ
jgi:hypothetical protein